MMFFIMVNLCLLTAAILVQQDYAGQAHYMTNGDRYEKTIFTAKNAKNTEKRERYWTKKPTKAKHVEVDLCVPCVLCGEYFCCERLQKG